MELNTNLNKSDINEYQVRQIIAQMLLDSVLPLTNAITKAVSNDVISIVSDYVIAFRGYFLQGIEFKLPKNAAILSGIPLITIYNWISRGLLQLYTIEGTGYVSMTQLRSLPGYQKRIKSNPSGALSQSNPHLATLEDSKVSPEVTQCDLDHSG